MKNIRKKWNNFKSYTSIVLLWIALVCGIALIRLIGEKRILRFLRKTKKALHSTQRVPQSSSGSQLN